MVVDVFMPNLSGFATCRALRAETALDETPIILMSARADPRLKVKGQAAGATATIPKPRDLDHLARILLTILNNGSLVRRSSGMRA